MLLLPLHLYRGFNNKNIISLSIPLSFFICLSLSVCLSVSLSLSVSLVALIRKTSFLYQFPYLFFIYLSLSLCLSLSRGFNNKNIISLSIPLSFFVCLSLSLCLSVSPSLVATITISSFLYIHFLIYFCLSLCLYVRLTLSLCLSFCPCISLSLCHSPSYHYIVNNIIYLSRSLPQTFLLYLSIRHSHFNTKPSPFPNYLDIYPLSVCGPVCLSFPLAVSPPYLSQYLSSVCMQLLFLVAF